MSSRLLAKSSREAGAVAADPLWYQDAVVYQLHVRSFCDSNADGIGDFRGLASKLDYLQDLGVTAIWLLPFFPSPLRDDGYDTADYRGVNPIYGTLRDFRAFLREARARRLRVITEMVMNHTSDQHEWFQRARRAKPGDPWRDYYVWSDSADRYREARIIFQDFEASNWTWDPVAGAHYWHRFYHHQPDLNFDNPEVRQAMLDAVSYWLEMGVDGLRLDAVPYLYEREGTNCENLPETHAFLRELRRHVDATFPDKMLLAEANQWPEDAAAYFGAGDECHMNFHFPLMPRLFMALEREDRFPVLDILEQTPAIPPGCQWGIFLRNHDELTLEMVTDEERDSMYRAYADDPRARVNLGIRRRLAPLLRNDRRKIELMHALLLSLPGTPILYYGDELGMGDNIYLGDRDGVRTPMQWNADRNAGFSRGNPQQLYLPPVIDPEYHYQALNVEVQQNSPHSLLWWMRRIIAARKQIRAFCRGSIEFLAPENSKVLAYLRRHEDETVLVVANLSRFAQCAELDLSPFRGQIATELFGQTRFPPIGELPYFLTLGPYAFYWFRLSWPAAEAGSVGVELPVCSLSGGWDNFFRGPARGKLEAALPGYLRRQEWFDPSGRALHSVAVSDVVPIEGPPERGAMRLLLLQAAYAEGDPDTYLLPVVFAQREQAANITADHPRAGILRVERSDGEPPAILCEAIWEPELWHALYDALAREKAIKGERGEIVAEHERSLFRRASAGNGRPARGKRSAAHEPGAAAGPHGDEASARPPAVSVHGGELRNTSAHVDDRFLVKLFRRLSPGENPDLEIGRFLTGGGAPPWAAKLAGALVYRKNDDEATAKRGADSLPITLAVAHELVRHECDAWTFTLDELGRYVERVESIPPSDAPARPEPNRHTLLELAGRIPPDWVHSLLGGYLQSVERLALRTAEMHAALASGDAPAFAPEPFTRLYQRSLYQSMRSLLRRTVALLKKGLGRYSDELRAAARDMIAAEPEALSRFRRLIERPIAARRVRCHGDYRLGQVLFTGIDFVLIDFEGDSSRPISERRIKRSPVSDVTSMVVSLRSAASAALLGRAPGTTPHRDGIDVGGWIRLWHVWTSAAFLRTYLAAARPAGLLPQDDEELGILLDAYLLFRALQPLEKSLERDSAAIAGPLEAVLELLALKNP